MVLIGFFLVLSFQFVSIGIAGSKLVPNDKTNEVLYPVNIDGKYGYINQKGNLTVKPQYDWGERFSEGLAVVKIGDKHGYIAQNGKLVIGIKYTYAEAFSEGLAVVKIGDKYGYIDKKGTVVIKSQYKVAYKFSEGLASVKRQGDRFCTYIDKNGKEVIKTKYSLVGEFHNSYAYVEIPSGNRFVYGYINKNGQLKIKHPKAVSIAEEDELPITDFSEGYGIITILSNGKLKKVFVDVDGKQLGNQEYDDAEGFSEGFAAVRYNGKSGYIDKTGKMIIQGQFTAKGKFSEGLANVISLTNGKTGFIDKKGKMVIKPEYDKVISPFSNGLCEVEYLDKECYIDRNGKIIWFPEMDEDNESGL